MSTIKTTYIQHPSAASPNLELAADGTVVLPLSDLEDLANVSGSPTDGQVLAYDSGSSAWGPVNGGKVLQTVFSSLAANVNITATSFTTAGLSATITPSNASNKILVFVSTFGGVQEFGTNHSAKVQLEKNGSALFDESFISLNAALGQFSDSTVYAPGSIVYSETAGSTSPITYEATFLKSNGGKVIILSNSSILLMELAA